ncbi:hypothetical protein GCM10010841_31170 [Deinococcus aerophilus]|uniref:Uncharacterized protein n=1 Tax=Deinococcus aerophilus TaxID=522488 RepID=A0ABQ2H0W9_9DEIO|nr:hypothetical protein GCM10010841_31170 [Deinococcus aerophilus]
MDGAAAQLIVMQVEPSVGVAQLIAVVLGECHDREGPWPGEIEVAGGIGMTECISFHLSGLR